MKALIFDCDGVLVDTERDGHRVAFNRTFKERGYPFQWSVEEYGQLLKIAGGKERMAHYFGRNSWPEEVTDRTSFLKELHLEKTKHFMQIIESGELPLRPGVSRLIDETIARGIMLAVCSTSNEKAVNLVVEKLLGAARKSKFSAILAGDVVSKKKPDPEIYNLAAQKLDVDPRQCMVVEDSRNGLLAAHRAGMRCIITTNGYTEAEDFKEADLIVPQLDGTGNTHVNIEALIPIIDTKSNTIKEVEK